MYLKSGVAAAVTGQVPATASMCLPDFIAFYAVRQPVYANPFTLSQAFMDLRELRQRANLRVIDVAYQIDVSETSVRNWESGRTIPKLRLDEFGLLAQLYGCTLDVLYAAMQETQAKAAKHVEE